MRKQLLLHSSFLLLLFYCLQKYLKIPFLSQYTLVKESLLMWRHKCNFLCSTTACFSFTNLPMIDPNETVNCKSDVINFKKYKDIKHIKMLFVYLSKTNVLPQDSQILGIVFWVFLQVTCFSSTVVDTNHFSHWCNMCTQECFKKKIAKWVAMPWILPGCTI